MIVDKVWKLTNTVRVGLDARSSHAQTQSTFPDTVCSYCPPCHGVLYYENLTNFLFFSKKKFPKDYVRKTAETLEAQAARRKKAVEKNAQRTDMDETMGEGGGDVEEDGESEDDNEDGRGTGVAVKQPGTKRRKQRSFYFRTVLKEKLKFILEKKIRFT